MASSAVRTIAFSLAAVAVALVAAGLGYVYLVFGDGIRNVVERQDKARQYERIGFFEQKDQRLVDYIQAQGVVREDLPAFCTALIYDNSIKGYEDAYNRKVRVLQGMLAEHLADPARPKPLTKCDSRALVLGSLLHGFGFTVRMVHTMGYDGAGNFMGHTFLEVLEADGWNLYDPYFGISYEDPDGGPVTALRAVLLGIDDLVPVSTDGRGWEANAPRLNKTFMDRLYGLAIYDNRMNGRASTVVVNAARIRRTTQGAVPDGLDAKLLDYLRYKWLDPVMIFL